MTVGMKTGRRRLSIIIWFILCFETRWLGVTGMVFNLTASAYLRYFGLLRSSGQSCSQIQLNSTVSCYSIVKSKLESFLGSWPESNVLPNITNAVITDVCKSYTDANVSINSHSTLSCIGVCPRANQSEAVTYNRSILQPLETVPRYRSTVGRWLSATDGYGFLHFMAIEARLCAIVRAVEEGWP